MLLQDQITRLQGELAELRSRARDAAKRPGAPNSGSTMDGDAIDNQERQRRDLQAEIDRKNDDIARLSAELAEQPKLALDHIIANTRLYSLKNCLENIDGSQPGSLAHLLNDKQIQWRRFGDSEALALGAWAEVLSKMQNSEPSVRASRLLCEHILRYYYPEHFDTLRTLLLTPKPGTMGQEEDQDQFSQRQAKLLFTLKRWQQFDPASALYPYLCAEYYESYANFAYNIPAHKPFGEGDYKSAAKLYKRACQISDDTAVHHANFASALEKREKQLEDGGPDAPARRKACHKLRADAIAAWKRACQLDPRNEEYRASLVSLQSREWVCAHKLASVVNSYAPTYLLEIQFSSESKTDFLKAEGTLEEGLQERTQALRRRLKQDLGITLPGVTFRDNLRFKPDQYRLLVRDVTGVEGVFRGASREEKWDQLMAYLDDVARARISEYFGPQDVMNLLADWKKNYGNSLGFEENPDSVGALTLVLKGLLNEDVPVTALDTILSQFAEGRACGLSPLSIGERIRSAPGLREKIPGNDAATPIRLSQLSEQLEAKLETCMDRSWPEPLFRDDMGRLISLAGELIACMQSVGASEATGIVASAANRPFVKKLIEGQFRGVPVLSEREILPVLAARIEGELCHR